MDFGIEKCAMIQMKRGKFVISEGIELPNGKKIRSLDDQEGYKYLGILQFDDIKHREMKEKLKKEYVRRVRKILKSHLNGGNVIQAINARAVSIIRYSAGILDWTKLELQELDRQTRKLLNIYRALHPQADVDRLYWKRAEGGRGLLSVEECVKIEQTNIGYYIYNSSEMLLAEVGREGIVSDEGDPKDKKKELTEARKHKYLQKKLHPVFYKETMDVRDEENSWNWLKNGYLKKETEGTILAAQDQALRTNWIKSNVDKENISSKCRMCGEREETIAHIVSECQKLAQREYKSWRHDKVAAVIHWYLCKKFGFECDDKYYNHIVTRENRVLENDEVLLLWDFSIQTETRIDHKKPDIMLKNKKEKTCQIIDVACPFDTRVKQKEEEKLDHYNELKYQILKMWKDEVKNVAIIPVVIGALGVVSKRFKSYIAALDFDPGVQPLQKACLIGTARIVRKVLDIRE